MTEEPREDSPTAGDAAPPAGFWRQGEAARRGSGPAGRTAGAACCASVSFDRGVTWRWRPSRGNPSDLRRTGAAGSFPLPRGSTCAGCTSGGETAARLGVREPRESHRWRNRRERGVPPRGVGSPKRAWLSGCRFPRLSRPTRSESASS